MDVAERLDQREALEKRVDTLRPVLRREDNVAVQPHDLAAAGREAAESHVEQPLLLPHDVPVADLDENVRVIVG